LKDVEAFRADILSVRAQIDDINKVLPIAEAKIPETIKRLREERDDVLLLLKSLETELQLGKISLGDYNIARSKALEKLRKIEDQLIEEWKRIEKFIESGGIEAIPFVERKEAEEKEGEEFSSKEGIEVKEEEKVEKSVEVKEEKPEISLAPESFVEEEKREGKSESESKKEKFEPKFVEPIKVKGKQDVLKVLKKVKEVV